MALAHDKEGFLTGQAANVDTASYARHLALLREIRNDGASVRGDVSAIRKALANPAPKVPQAVAVPAQKSAANDPRIKRAAPTVAPAARPVSPKSGAASEMAAPTRTGSTSPREREIAQSQVKEKIATPRRADGRFEAKNRSPDGHDSPQEEKDARDARDATSALGEAASDLSRGAGEMLAGAEQVDPTLAAAKEVKEIVSPALGLFKPLGRLFRRKPGASDAEKAVDKTVPWYRRLWNELRDINKKSGKGGGFLSSLLGGLAALAALIVKFSGLGLLAKLLAGLFGGLRLPGMGRGRTGRAGRSGGSGRGRDRSGRNSSAGGSSRKAPEGADANKGTGKSAGGKPSKSGAPGKGGTSGKGLGGLWGKGKGLGKSLLRRVPLIGTLLAGGSILSSIFGGDDPEKSSAENRKDRFNGAGGGIGAIIGGAIGMLGGPIGVVVGGVLGDVVGSKVGDWLSVVDWSAVGKTMSDAWKSAAEWTKSAFDGAAGFVKESWGKLTDVGTKVFGAVSDWFNEKLGIAKTALNTAATSVKEAAGQVAAKAKDVGNAVRDKSAEVATGAVDTVKNAANKVTGGAYKGGSNARKEALINAMNEGGITDVKSQAALMATVDNETGGFRRNEENLNYSAKRLREVFPKYYKTDADAERDARNPEAIANRVYGGRMGNNSPGDGYKYRGRGDIQLTGKDQYATMGKRLGLDLVNNPDLALDPEIASKIAVEFWKMSGADRAAASGDTDKARRIVNGGNIGLEHTREKYKEYLPQAQAGAFTRKTADQTKAAPPPVVAQAITTAAQPPQVPPPATPVTASAKPVTYAAASPDLAKYAPKDAPAVSTPVGSSQKQTNVPMRIETPLTQNVGDRNIAAVATGGIGMQAMRN